MAIYRFKNGKLPKSLIKSKVECDTEKKAPLLEDDNEPTGAFFTGEESTKVFSSASINESDEFESLFEDDEPKKKSKVKISDFLGKKRSQEASEEILKEVDEVYSDTHVKDIDETMSHDHMSAFTTLAKPKVNAENDSLDGENDDYEEDSSTLEDLFSEDADIEDFDDEEDNEVIQAEIKSEKKDSFREYTSPDEREEFLENYKRASRKALLSALSCLFFTVLLFLHEAPGFIHPKLLTAGSYGILYLLFDLQLLFFACISSYDVIILGAKALFKWHPTKYSVSFVLALISVIQVLLHLIFDSTSEETLLFSSIAALSVLICKISKYFDTRREGITFKAMSSDAEKFIAESLTDESEEYSAFEQYLPDDYYLHSVKKTGFISGFVEKSRQTSSFNEIYKIILPLIIFTSVLFTVIASIISSTPTFGRSIDNFVLAIMISTPIISAMSITLPFFKGTVKLSKRGCGIIGESSLDEASSTNIISFKDTDAFHEKGITLTSVKPFGNTQIDKAIFAAARVFNLVGGPLKAVFNRSIIDPGSSGASVDDEIMQILPNSIIALIDNQNVTFGTKIAVMAQGVVISDDPVDNMFENKGGRIMYMLVENELAAKFYIKYSLGKNFRAILDNFCDVGVFMVIKSADPNLDTEYLTKLMRDENYPIIVTKLNEAEYTNACATSESEPTTVFSNTSVPNLLRTFAWCDKCRKIINLNNLSKYITIILSIIILIICLINADSHEKITPALVLLYQFIWSIPIIGTSLFQ